MQLTCPTSEELTFSTPHVLPAATETRLKRFGIGACTELEIAIVLGSSANGTPKSEKLSVRVSRFEGWLSALALTP